MAAVKSRGNKSTELKLIKILRAEKISGWRRNSHSYGKPDLVFPGMKIAVFVDGCFWHGCKRHRSLPTSNKIFWRDKIRRNKERDRKVNRKLRSMKWEVIRIWEHEITRNQLRVSSKIRKLGK